MMQIPPPSPEHLSLLTELFNPNKLSEKQKSHQQQQHKHQHQHPKHFQSQILEERHESLSLSDTRNLPILQQRPQFYSKQQLHDQLKKEQTRKMTRTKSPSQKIPRNNNNNNNNNNNTAPNHSNAERFETDENGNPKICFSYRTMAKQYERDTLRMLERIQKSRSFDQQQRDQNQNSKSTTANTTTAQRSASLADLTKQERPLEDFLLDHNDNDGGFYIGDDSFYGDDDPHNDFNNHGIGIGIGNQFHVDGEHLFQEEEEIFELDL